MPNEPPLPSPERFPRLHGPSRIAWWAAVAYALILVASYSFSTVAPGLLVFSKYLQYLPLTLGGGVALWMASRRQVLLPGTRSALRWLGTGLLGSCLGMIWYIYIHEVIALPRGLPRFGDAAFLLSYLAIVIGLTRLPRRAPGQYEAWKVALDAAVVAVGVGLVGWHLIIAPTTVAIDGPLDLFIRVAYPVLDIAFLFALNGVIIGGGPAEHRRAFAWVAGAILAYIVAESLYQVMYYGPNGASPPFERASEFFFTLAYLCFVGAGLRYCCVRDEVGKAQHALVSAFSPLPLIATAGVALLVTRGALDPDVTMEPALVLGLVALSFLLLVRQGLTAGQNADLLRREAQREGDTRVAALVRHSSDLIIVTEPTGVVRFVSPSSERILGLVPSALAGRPLLEFVHAGDHVPLAEASRDPAEGRSTVPLRLAHASGDWVEFDVVLTDLTDEPAVSGVVYVARDLTERNAFESRLRQSQKMEAVGRLAGGVAHDFNNLLTTILASTDLLLERSLAQEVREDLEVIRQASGRAAGLTGQLLAFSRQEGLQRRPLDLNVLTDETASLLRRLLGTEVSLLVQRTSAASPIEGDANQLAQVIVNLALNARDAMPRGGTLTIRTGHTVLASALETAGGIVPSGPYAVLEVQDTGSGMDTTTLARIFEPFFTTKAAGKGTGLGLATTQRIVEQHDGGIEVQSTPGLGTTIRIYLPSTAAVVDAPSAATGSLRSQEGSETILVVEDEASVREVTARILTRLGYQVLTAAEAGQARRLLADQSVPTPAMMVTDVMMPGMTGPELAERVADDYPGMRILFMSGYPGDELGRLGLRADQVPFLQKPFTPVELAERIREILDQR